MTYGDTSGSFENLLTRVAVQSRRGLGFLSTGQPEFGEPSRQPACPARLQIARQNQRGEMACLAGGDVLEVRHERCCASTQM